MNILLIFAASVLIGVGIGAVILIICDLFINMY